MKVTLNNQELRELHGMLRDGIADYGEKRAEVEEFLTACLGVAQAAPVVGDLLTAKERASLERVRPLHESNPDMLSPADIDPIFDMLDRLAPMPPTAAVRSPGQVAFETHLKAGDWEGLSDFVRANWELTAAAVLAAHGAAK